MYKKLWILLWVISLGHGDPYFDLEEVERINYIVDISDEPITGEGGEEALSPGYSVFKMKNKGGQPYHCLLPPSTTSKESENATPEWSPSMYEEVMDLLSPLKNHPCIFRTKDYWTYEFCYGKSIKQYHVQNSLPVGDIITLGIYDSDYSWRKEEERPLLRHHSQFYVNGSVCDDIGAPRKTEVRYVCVPDATMETISQIEETVLCEYVLTITTSKTCSLPHLLPIPEEAPRIIQCSPLLNPHLYSIYVEDKERKAALAKRNKGRSIGDIVSVLTDKMEEEFSDKIVKQTESVIKNRDISGSNSILAVVDLFKNEDEDEVERIDPPEKESSHSAETMATTEDDLSLEKLLEDSSATIKNYVRKHSPNEANALLSQVEKRVASHVDKIIDETSKELKVLLKPLDRTQAVQALSTKLDGFIKTLSDEIDKVKEDIDSSEQKIETDIKALKESLDEKDADEPMKKDEYIAPELEEENVENNSADEELLMVEVDDNELIGRTEDKAQQINELGESLKRDGKPSVKKDIRTQELEESDGEVNLPRELGNEEDLSDRAYDEAIKKLESAVKKKLENKIENVEIRIISSSKLGLDSLGDSESVNDKALDSFHQNQAVHHLMVRNFKAYEEVAQQSRSLKGYKFSFSENVEDKSNSEDDIFRESELVSDETVKETRSSDKFNEDPLSEGSDSFTEEEDLKEKKDNSDEHLENSNRQTEDPVLKSDFSKKIFPEKVYL